MTSKFSLQPNMKASTCPHGLPQSLCPVCGKQNSAGGMNMAPVSKYSKPSNEWSYQKCYAVWQDIKSAIKHKEETKTFFDKQFQTAIKNDKNFMQNIKLPFWHSSVRFLMNTAINTLFNTFSQVSKFIEKISEFQQKSLNMIFQAGEKITNIIGEIKNFVARKLIEDLKKKAKKFMLICFSSIEDENYKNDDTLAVFKSREMKKYMVKTDDNSGSNKQ